MTEIRNVSTDMYTHCINVCSLSTILALKLKMTDRQVHNVALGAILHDIGLKYIRVPYENISIEDMNYRDLLNIKAYHLWIQFRRKRRMVIRYGKRDYSSSP